MSGAAAGSSATAKMQETKPESEPPKDQKPQQPTILEEDDEFEDFPVEGMKHFGGGEDCLLIHQIGHKRKLKCLGVIHIYGKRAGTTMMILKSSPNN